LRRNEVFEMRERHYKAGYTEWMHKNGKITKQDDENLYQIMHFVIGMDGNEHRVFWHSKTLYEAVEYLDRQG
jgi:hypothetical protein